MSIDFIEIGRNFESTSEYSKAIDAYEKALEFAGNGYLYAHIGRLIKISKGVDEAYKYFKDLNSNRNDVSFEMGLILLEEYKDYTAAKLFLYNAIKTKPNLNAWHHIKYVKCLYLLKNYKDCLENLSGILDRSDLNDNQKLISLELKGDVLVKLENSKLAIETYITFLGEKPGETKIYYKIANLLRGEYPEEILETIKGSRNIPISILENYIKVTKESKEVQSKDSTYCVYREMSPWRKRNLSEVLDFGKVQDLHYSINEQTEVNEWEKGVAEINDGIGYSDINSFSYITNVNKEVFTDLSIGGYSIIHSCVSLSKPQEVNGRVAFLSQYFGAVNYCHWLLDIFPRLGLLTQAGFVLEEFDYFVFNNYKAKFQKETLAKVGIDHNRIITSDKVPVVKASKLIVPTIGMHPANSGSEESIRYLKSVFLKDELEPKKLRLYFNRKNEKKRQVVNELEFESMLCNNFGFTSVAMHQHSVDEQADLASQAEIIIAPHGAALTNITFCQSGTKIIEIFSPVYGTNTYRVLADGNKLNYFSFVGVDFDNSLKDFNSDTPNNQFGKKDIFIDVNLFESSLKRII